MAVTVNTTLAGPSTARYGNVYGALSDLGLVSGYGATDILGSTSPSALSILQTYGGTLFAPSTSTCFVDSAGSTHATLDGLVGCIVDPATEEGPELITNGGFDTDTAWTKGTGWAISSGVASRTNVAAKSHLTTPLALTAGKAYLISYTCTVTSGNISPSLGGGTNFHGVARTASGTYTEYLRANTGNYELRIYASATFAGTIDNISVREVGLIAFQSTTGNKPRLRKGTVTAGVSDGIGPWWLDFDGVDDALAVQGLDAGYADSTIITANYGVVQTTAQSQDIRAGLSFTADNAGKIIVPADNALAAGELATLQAYANTLGGYTP